MSVPDTLPERVRCLRWHYRDDPPFCGLFNCHFPDHGFDVRKRRATTHQRLLTGHEHLYTCAAHVNERCHGFQASELCCRIRKEFDCLFLTAASLVIFPHVQGADTGMDPYPHLHLLATAREGYADLARLQGFTQASCALGAKVSFLRASRIRWGDWQEVQSPDGFLLYLYQATESHRHLAPDCLPPRGSHYRQVYGRPGHLD